MSPARSEHASLAPGVLGDHDQPAARSQHRVAGGEDLGHRRGVGVAAGVADVGPVGRVVEGVGRAEPAAGQPGRLVDHPGVARVRRGGDDQVDLPGVGRRASRRGGGRRRGEPRLGGVACRPACGRGSPRPGRPSALRVPRRRRAGRAGRPRRAVVPIPARGSTTRAPGSEYSVTMRRASSGSILPGWRGAVRQVAAGPLPLGGGLGHRPDGQRHGRGGAGVVGGSWAAHDRTSVTYRTRGWPFLLDNLLRLRLALFASRSRGKGARLWP